MPAMLDGKGYVVKPDYVQVYYKRSPDGPDCDPSAGGARSVGIPNGLRFIAGFNMTNGSRGVQPGNFHCGSAVFPNLTQAKAYCPAGSKLGMTVASLKCWNGELDSADHRSHLSGMMYGVCPSSHPYLLPQFTITAFYTILPGDDLSLWSLSSDEMFPDLPKGTTLHFDYFEAWDSGVKAMWMANCIGKKLNCSGGDLGNGKQLKGASQPAYGWKNPNPRVPVPSGGSMAAM